MSTSKSEESILAKKPKNDFGLTDKKAIQLVPRANVESQWTPSNAIINNRTSSTTVEHRSSDEQAVENCVKLGTKDPQYSEALIVALKCTESNCGVASFDNQLQRDKHLAEEHKIFPFRCFVPGCTD